MCGFDQLVFVMPQTFVPFTETGNDKTKGMNLLLEKVEPPGSQRTAVILGSRGVTLPDTLFRHVLDHLPIKSQPILHLELMAEVTAVTDRVTNQLNTLTRFAVTDYMAEGDDMSAAGDMFLPE